jgi:hypothetical protein
MVLLAGERRRLLRAAVVGGLGSATSRSERLVQAHHVHQRQQDVRPDTDATSLNELGAEELGI